MAVSWPFIFSNPLLGRNDIRRITPATYFLLLSETDELYQFFAGNLQNENYTIYQKYLSLVSNLLSAHRAIASSAVTQISTVTNDTLNSLFAFMKCAQIGPTHDAIADLGKNHILETQSFLHFIPLKTSKLTSPVQQSSILVRSLVSQTSAIVTKDLKTLQAHHNTFQNLVRITPSLDVPADLANAIERSARTVTRVLRFVRRVDKASGDLVETGDVGQVEKDIEGKYEEIDDVSKIEREISVWGE